MVEMKDRLEIKFDGAVEDMSLHTLLNSLFGMAGLMQEIVDEMAPGERLDVRIEAPQRGSFLIRLNVVPTELIEMAKNLFSIDGIKAAGGFATMVATLLKLKGLLGRKAPEKIEINGAEVVVTGENGGTIIVNKPVYNIYQKSEMHFHRIVRPIDEDPRVQSIEILDSASRPVFHASREEFPRLLELPAESGAAKERIDFRRATLTIIKASFSRSLKWEFLLDGNRVAAALHDRTFLDSIDQRKRTFSKGDMLDVDLRVRQELHPDIGLFVNRAYDVMIVHEHISVPRQMSLPEERP